MNGRWLRFNRKMTSKLLVLAIVQTATFGAPKLMTWNIGGVQREAIVYSPTAKTASGKAPLVLAFHGHGDTVDNFQEVDLQVHWPQAVVVYPQGLPSARDSASGWQVEPGKDGDRDLKFVDQMVAALSKQFSVDGARIYATGFSNGASFTFLLWAQRPNVFAAYAPVAGRIWPLTHLTVPKPLFQVGGTADRTIPFEQQKKAMETARQTNGATGKGESCGSHCMRYDSANGAPVMTLIHGGGHEFPDEASQMIVDFSKKYSLAAR